MVRSLLRLIERMSLEATIELRVALIALSLGVFAHAPALACSFLVPVYPAWLEVERLPDESDAELAERRHLLVSSYEALQERNRIEQGRIQQAEMWDQSGAVALVEIESVDQDGAAGRHEPPDFWSEPPVRVVVRPVAWLKGTAVTLSASQVPSTFALQYSDFTSCGPLPSWSVMRGEPGERHIAYFRTGLMTQSDLREVVSIGAITDPRVMNALAANVR